MPRFSSFAFFICRRCAGDKSTHAAGYANTPRIAFPATLVSRRRMPLW